MQEIFGFLGLVIIISASGVMSPGPLFAANNGPGDITPDAEIIITNPKKPNISCKMK